MHNMAATEAAWRPIPAATSPARSAPLTIRDKALRGIGNLIKLLPTGTVFLFQFLTPILTNNGHCNPPLRLLTGAFLAACALSCCFSCFTDSYVESSTGAVRYGVATAAGILPLDGGAPPSDARRYRLRFGDFVHALNSLVVFAAVGVLDSNTVECFFPAFRSSEMMRVLLMVLPPVVGGISSAIFVVFPNGRHGIGYPASAADD